MQNSSEHEGKQADSSGTLLGVYLANIAQGFGVAVLAALIPTYANLFDAHPFWIGLFSSAFAAANIVSVLPLGWLADRWDQRSVLLGGLGVIALSYAGFLLVGDVVSLTVIRFLQGLGTTAATITCLSLTGDRAPQGARGRAIGTLSALEAMANAGGAVAGGWLYARFGFTVTYTVLLVLTILAAAVVRLYVPPDTRRIRDLTFWAILRDRRIRSVATYRLVFSFGKNLMRTFVPIYAGVVLGLNPVQVGAVISAESTVNMLLQRYGGILSDRYGRLPIITLGTGLYSIGVLLALTQHSFLGLLIVNAALGLADAVRVPAEMALFADAGRNLGIASTFSVRAIIYRPGAVLGPMIGGAVMGYAGIDLVFVLAAAFTAGALLALLLALRTHG